MKSKKRVRNNNKDMSGAIHRQDDKSLKWTNLCISQSNELKEIEKYTVTKVGKYHCTPLNKIYRVCYLTCCTLN